MAEELSLDGLQTRAAPVLEVREDEDYGYLDVKIVPYEIETQLADRYFETFSRGAFAGAVGNPKRCVMSNAQHDRANPIGRAIELRDQEDGHYGTIRIPKTDLGSRVLKLIRGEVLEEISVEFFPQKRYRREVWRGDELHIRHDRATLLGCSPVVEGAYGENARILAMRERANFVRERELALLGSLRAGIAQA